jgi:hypothetical protein
MTRLLAAAVISALTLTGCATLSPEGELVSVVRNALAVGDCASLGEVEATSGWGGLFAGAAGLESNKRSLRTEAARRGGDTLLILAERATFAPHTIGEVYRCGQ